MTPALALAGGLVLSATIVALAVGEPQRNQSLVASTSEAEVCMTDGLPGSAYSRARRVVARRGRPGYERDHRVPLCAGGADTEVNLQWQPIDEALDKDALERFACAAVCRYHSVTLAEAQSWFLGDWRREMWRVEQ